MVDRPKKRQGITSEILLPAARRQEWLGCFWERWSFLGEQTQLLLWAAGGTCSGDWDEASVCSWGSSRVLGAAPARWQEEFQALQRSLCSTCSCCGQDGLFKEILIHQIEGTASRISSGDILVGKSLEALILILYFQASGLRNAVKTRDPSRKTCPVFLPVQLGLTACVLSIWKSFGELHLFLSQVKQ